MKKWMRTTSILSLFALSSAPVLASGGPDIASMDPLAPRILIPSWTPEALPSDIDAWVRRTVAEAASTEASSGDALLESVAMQMLDRYDVSDLSEEEQASRFLSIANGEAAADYEKSNISEDAVRFSKDSFAGFSDEAPVAEAVPAETAKNAETDAAFLAFLASPEGMQTLSMMSGDQISAIAALVSAMRSDVPPEQLFGRPASALDGVPELSEDPSATDVAALVKSMTDPSAATAPEVRDVGDGKNLLLAGWEARLTDEGGVEIFNASMEGSALPVVEGMVLGPFGPVQTIEASEAGVTVVFASGETITSIETPLEEGVPALADAGQGTPEDVSAGGEFILSALPDLPAGAQAAPLSPETVVADAVIPEGGLVSSLRPKPRPANLLAEAKLSDNPLASLRPKPRPENLVVAAAEAVSPKDALTRSLRPKPRPASLSSKTGGT